MVFSDQSSGGGRPGSAPADRAVARSADSLALRRHRALAEPSRARILAELAGDGPLGARALAGRVGLHVNTVRAHLNALTQAGLVSGETLAPRGRGRPQMAYRATDAVAAEDRRRHGLLAEILTGLVARLGLEAGRLEETGESWGRYLADSPRPGTPVPDGAAVAGLLGLLSELGFAPRLTGTGRARRLRMRPCPFLELAQAQRDVICPIHLGLMRGALAELGATTRVTGLEPFARPDVCVARLAGPPTA